MAGQAIYFQATRHAPAGLIGAIGSHASGHSPSKTDVEFAAAHPQLLRPVGARPGAIRKWNLGGRLAIYQHPGLPVAAGRHTGEGRVEMPATADGCGIVAIAAARLGHRKRHGATVARLDCVALGIAKSNDMGRLAAASGAIVSQLRLGLSLQHRDGGKRGRQ